VLTFGAQVGGTFFDAFALDGPYVTFCNSYYRGHYAPGYETVEQYDLRTERLTFEYRYPGNGSEPALVLLHRPTVEPERPLFATAANANVAWIFGSTSPKRSSNCRTDIARYRKPRG
jgi:hypothetical protein